MKGKNKIFLLVGMSLLVLAIASSIALKETTQVKEWLNVDKVSECETMTYTEEVPIIKNVTMEKTKWGTCTGFSEQNLTAYTYPCPTGTEEFTGEKFVGYQMVNKTKQVCRGESLVLNSNYEQKELVYKQFGDCSYKEIEEGISITCDSKHDGNGDGVCQSGESCCFYTVTTAGVKSNCDIDSSFAEQMKPVEVLK